MFTWLALCLLPSLIYSLDVKVISRDTSPILSYVDKTSTYQQIFNPTWIEGSIGTQGKKGLFARTQNCQSDVGGTCVFCGGSADKASILTFSEEDANGRFSPVDSSNIIFGPSDSTDSWGTEDPRAQYDPKSGMYYMFYTAYNGSSIFLSLATSSTPLDTSSWTKHGAVFPNHPNSKSAALLLRDSPPHYLLWGDSSIRIAKSDDPLTWPDEGEIFLQTRNDHFDSKLVESGPPPMKLSSGDYLFFYNSAEIGWPDDLSTAYHVGWLILDRNDPSHILARSEEPLLAPEYAWDKGQAPYACNVPNVVFLEAAYPLGDDKFKVFFGGADAVIGAAVVQVTL